LTPGFGKVGPGRAAKPSRSRKYPIDFCPKMTSKSVAAPPEVSLALRALIVQSFSDPGNVGRKNIFRVNVFRTNVYRTNHVKTNVVRTNGARRVVIKNVI
jgi:hypothetical protein